MWVRPRPRCRDSSQPVSMGHPPHRTCPSPGIRRSSSPLGVVFSWCWGHGRRPLRPPVAVARSAHLAGVEQRDLPADGSHSAAAVAAEFVSVHPAVLVEDQLITRAEV